MSRTDCIRLALIGSLMMVVPAALPARGQEAESTLAPINLLREDEELPPLSANAALDAVAAEYLAGMIEAQCLCPAAGVDAGAERVLADVRDALKSDAAIVDAGLVTGYDQTSGRAIATTALDPANGSAILGSRMTQIGMATAVIGAGQSWLAPPPGGDGPAIDLTGYTVVVILTAGSGQ